MRKPKSTDNDQDRVVLAPEPRFITRAEADKRLEKAEATKLSGPMVTYVGVCLDRSGSMDVCKQATINGFNEQVQRLRSECKQDAGDQVYLTLVTFNSQVDIKFKNKDIFKAPLLDSAAYIPDGMTAMYDGIVETIKVLEDEERVFSGKENVAFLLVVLTDGQENASVKNGKTREENRRYCSELLQMKQGTGRWTVVFIGANIDVTATSGSLSVPVSNSVAYSSTPIGTQQVFSATDDALGNYFNARRSGSLEVRSFYSNDNKVKDLTVGNKAENNVLVHD